VLVTGASSGIGAGIAQALADAGATVVAAARRLDRVEAFAQRVRAAGGDALAVELDVRDEGSVARALERVRERYGRLDALVNNAGMLGRGGVSDATADGWKQSVETNLLGAMLVTQAAFGLLTVRPGGDIVAISSSATRSLGPGSAPYGAAKSGLNGFFESVRKELAPKGIRVIVISPGFVASEFYDHTAADVRRPWMKEITPLQPADLGNAVVFALAAPRHVSINEMMIRPTTQVG
jgi:NADP-dependent 3-hydroxy acid dehydrogenase YdfG